MVGHRRYQTRGVGRCTAFPLSPETENGKVCLIFQISVCEDYFLFRDAGDAEPSRPEDRRAAHSASPSIPYPGEWLCRCTAVSR